MQGSNRIALTLAVSINSGIADAKPLPIGPLLSSKAKKMLSASLLMNHQATNLVLQVRNGDTIRIDAEQHVVEAVDVTPEEFGARLAQWSPPLLKYTQGTLYKYIKSVSSASLGCVTDL